MASERLFTQSEYLTTQTMVRRTIVISDRQAVQEKPQQPKGHDHQEVFINYDAEYDKLRRLILSMINDISSQADHTLQSILYQNMG